MTFIKGLIKVIVWLGLSAIGWAIIISLVKGIL